MHFTGRTKYFLSAFGEQPDQRGDREGGQHGRGDDGGAGGRFPCRPSLSDAAERAGASTVFLIEFSREPVDLANFTQRLDEALHELNKDYVAYPRRLDHARPARGDAGTHGRLRGVDEVEGQIRRPAQAPAKWTTPAA